MNIAVYKTLSFLKSELAHETSVDYKESKFRYKDVHLLRPF